MKPRGYKISVEKDRVCVEHRASLRLRTIVLWSLVYLCYCLLPHIRKVLGDFYVSRDPVIAGFALFMLLIPFLCFATWFFFASGEVMRCDAQELHLARRRSWGRWHRHHFDCAQIRELRKAWRGGPRRRSYTVLTFQYYGKTFDMLEDLNDVSTDQVLKACNSMGVNAVIVADDAAAMHRDIVQRGWFINPLRGDRDDSHSTR